MATILDAYVLKPNFSSPRTFSEELLALAEKEQAVLLPASTVPEHLFKDRILEIFPDAPIEYIDGEYRVTIESEVSPLEVHKQWLGLVEELKKEDIDLSVTMIMQHPVKLCYELDSPNQMDLFVLEAITEEEFMENMRTFEPTEADDDLYQSFSSMGINVAQPIHAYTGLSVEELEELESGKRTPTQIKRSKFSPRPVACRQNLT